MSRVVYKPYADRINNCYNIEHETTKVKSEINLLSSWKLSYKIINYTLIKI